LNFPFNLPILDRQIKAHAKKPVDAIPLAASADHIPADSFCAASCISDWHDFI